MKNQIRKNLDCLRPFIGQQQLQHLAKGLHSDESIFFTEAINIASAVIKDNEILHYLKDKRDWYIYKSDTESIKYLKGIDAELDIYWIPNGLRQRRLARLKECRADIESDMPCAEFCNKYYNDYDFPDFVDAVEAKTWEQSKKILV